MNEKVKEACGIQFPIPIETRYNSLFDATKAIVSKRVQIQDVRGDSKQTRKRMDIFGRIC